MALERVHIAEDKAELVRNLRSGDGAIGPFRTYSDIVTFAAALGFHNSRRVPLGNYSRKDPDAVLQEQIRSVEMIKLIDLAHTEDPEILSDDEVHDYIWAFDHGWFGVDDDYRIVIPQERFMEEPAVESREMVAFRGEAIGLPREREFRPSLEGLRWHRQRWTIG